MKDLTLAQILPSGRQNYGLRLLANGRLVCFEVFRTRLDALIASTLSNGIDLNKVLTQFCSSDADLNDWTVKQQAVRNLCDTFSS